MRRCLQGTMACELIEEVWELGDRKGMADRMRAPMGYVAFWSAAAYRTIYVTQHNGPYDPRQREALHRSGVGRLLGPYLLHTQRRQVRLKAPQAGSALKRLLG